MSLSELQLKIVSSIRLYKSLHKEKIMELKFIS